MEITITLNLPDKRADHFLSLLAQNETVKTGTRIDSMGFSARTVNVLRRAQIKYLHQLLGHTESDLLKYANFGTTCKKDVRKVLGERGLALDKD